jgi:hypothetical protein
VSGSLINAQHLTSAAEARLLVAITFHFVEARLVYLDKVLRSLATFPVRKRDIVVFTNTTDSAEQASIRQVLRNAGLVDGRDARIAVEAHLAHPFDLTWAHKKLISGDFLAPGSPYSHFVYLEDDEQLTFENFVYFVVARDVLRPFDNLVPAFLRTEWCARDACCVNTDNNAPIMLAQRFFITHGDYAFVVPDNPYCGGFILDQELAREYANSPSFDLHRSRTVPSVRWGGGVRERAAMGLTFENPPAPFVYRVVVPVSIASGLAPDCSCLAHLPNNYADDPNHFHGKVAMTGLFAGSLNAEQEVTLASFQSARQKLSRLCVRVLTNFCRMGGWLARDILTWLLVSLGRARRSILGPRTSKKD